MLSSALAAANKAHQVTEDLERDKREKKLKSRRQRWFNFGGSSRTLSSSSSTKSSRSPNKFTDSSSVSSSRSWTRKKSKGPSSVSSLRSFWSRDSSSQNVDGASVRSGGSRSRASVAVSVKSNGSGSKASISVNKFRSPEPALKRKVPRPALRTSLSQTSIFSSRSAGDAISVTSFESKKVRFQFDQDNGEDETAESSLNNPVVKDLVQGLENDKMCDVTLLGREGVGVRANKFVLSAQSPAMQEFLYKDPSQLEAYLGDFGRLSIQAMKEYCYTGVLIETPLMRRRSVGVIRRLVEVAVLATKYGYPSLYAIVESAIKETINKMPNLSTAAYDTTSSYDVPPLDEHLSLFVQDRCPKLLLTTDAAKHLSSSRLDTLLKKPCFNDADKVRSLKKWVDLRGATPTNMEFAEQWVSKNVSLIKLMEDRTAVQLVKSCGFFDSNQVEELANGVRDDLSNMQLQDWSAQQLESLAAQAPLLSGTCYQITEGGEVAICSVHGGTSAVPNIPRSQKKADINDDSK